MVRVCVSFYIFYENFYFVRFIVDASTSFSLSPMEIAWVPKIVGGSCKVHRLDNTEITSHFLWQWQCATAKINTKQKPTKWASEMKSHWNCKMANSKKFNQFNCISECIQCNSILSRYCFAQLWLCSQFSVAKRPNKRYFIVVIMFWKKKKTYYILSGKNGNSKFVFYSMNFFPSLSLLLVIVAVVVVVVFRIISLRYKL